MTKHTNNTDNFIESIFNRNKLSDKQLLKVIGTGHGYETKDTDDIHIGLDLGSSESFSVSQNWRSDKNV